MSHQTGRSESSGGGAAKRLVPIAVTIGVCAFVLWPFRDESGREALVSAARHANPWTLPIIVAFTLLNWLTDAWATGMTFRYFGTKISIRDALFVRGATLIFDAVNPSLGQVALGVVLHRYGTPLARTVQTLVVLNVVFVLQLVVVAGIGLMLGHYESSGISTQVVLVALLGAAAYLGALAARPSFLVKRKAFAGLFEAGVKGHALAFAVRAPSIATMVVSVFVTFSCFGIVVPASAVLVYVPAIILITGVPVSVQGIGPTQVAQVAFFASYLNMDARSAEAVVIAWGLTTSVGNAVFSLLIGLGCLLTEAGRAAFVAGRSSVAEGSIPVTAVVDDHHP